MSCEQSMLRSRSSLLHLPAWTWYNSARDGSLELKTFEECFIVQKGSSQGSCRYACAGTVRSKVHAKRRYILFSAMHTNHGVTSNFITHACMHSAVSFQYSSAEHCCCKRSYNMFPHCSSLHQNKKPLYLPLCTSPPNFALSALNPACAIASRS